MKNPLKNEVLCLSCALQDYALNELTWQDLKNAEKDGLMLPVVLTALLGPHL